jgi:two-component system NtrC family sensor kinase
MNEIAHPGTASMRGGRTTSVRVRLLAIVLSPILLALPILAGLLLYWANAYYDRLLVYRITSDLATANQFLERFIGSAGQSTASLADSRRLADARGDTAALGELLAGAAATSGFSFVHLLDARGQRLQGGDVAATDRSHWPVVRKAIAGEASAALDVFSLEDLAAVDPALTEPARVRLVASDDAATAPAAAGAPVDETRGLMVHAAAPVRDRNGRVAAVLESGVLLNGNLDFVDRINAIVYPEGALPLGSLGTTTLFLDDLRIATNVRLSEGGRALGTRVSLAVRDAVLGRGHVWLDRAFVVNDWYMSGYQPLYDSFERRVGMLYVGFLERPFAHAKWTALATLFALFALLAAIASFVFLRLARAIFAPLERMRDTMRAVSAGGTSARVGPTARRDEIGELARHFDALLDELQAQRAELERLNAELDRKVAARTAELETAQRQLAMSEKLAALGQLTAGVAHEINNPAAVIQGNVDLAREILGERGVAPVAGELRLIDEQVNRIRLIVAKLLQFARPADFAGEVEDVDVNVIVADTLVLVRQTLVKRRIAIAGMRAATRTVRMPVNELQQVLVNLVVNAIQAMPDGGTITLTTRDDGDGVVITVEDTGTGIRPEDAGRIFDPFFTTKRGEGTGLGLSISYALVQRHGGRIEVESRPGEGATFSVFLTAQSAAPMHKHDTRAR